jgi:hypothetical protein
MAGAQNLVAINDEAHHAWRVPPKSRIPGVSKDELEEATEWIGGLDRIHKTRGILKCLDFTATPFAPTGRASGEETLFEWVAGQESQERSTKRDFLEEWVKAVNGTGASDNGHGPCQAIQKMWSASSKPLPPGASRAGLNSPGGDQIEHHGKLQWLHDRG